MRRFSGGQLVRINPSPLTILTEKIMICTLCGEDISGDCILECGICVFCFYNTDSWDSNGQLIARDQAIARGTRLRPRKSVGPSVNIQRILRHILDCVALAVTREATTTSVDVEFLTKVATKCGFLVLRVDFASVAGSEDAALRLAKALGRECSDLDLIMRTYTALQEKKRICVIVENFHYVTRLAYPAWKQVEGCMRSYIQGHRNASWLFFGTQEMLPTFADRGRPFFGLAFFLKEDDVH